MNSIEKSPQVIQKILIEDVICDVIKDVKREPQQIIRLNMCPGTTLIRTFLV